MYSIYFDGGSRGNPGPSGSGYVVYGENGFVQYGYKYLGENTNNYAEYTGLILALKSISDKTKPLKIYGDSKLVVCQIKGEYKVKATNLISLHQQCMELLKDHIFEIKHIVRSQNATADDLANKAMDTKQEFEYKN